MGDRTVSVRLKPEKYEELAKKAEAEGRTLAGYARARMFDDELRQTLKQINERLRTLEDRLRR